MVGVYYSLFNPLLIKGHLDRFLFLAIAKKAGINIHVPALCVCVNVSFHFSGLSAQACNCWVGSMIITESVFKETAGRFSAAAILSYLPFLPATYGDVSLLYFSHSGRCVVLRITV